MDSEDGKNTVNSIDNKKGFGSLNEVSTESDAQDSSVPNTYKPTVI